MPYRPVIGIVYDPRYANPAYDILISRLDGFQFNARQFDCRFETEQQLDRLVKENIEMIDGLLLPGGPDDIPPEVYGEERKPKFQYSKDTLLIQYQAKMVFEAKKRGMPILGICRGSNTLNILHGGKINQDITELDHLKKVNHSVFPLKGELAHDVTIKNGTHLHDILVGNDSTSRQQDLSMRINSWHHTGNTIIPENFVVSAVSPDSVTEAIEEKHPGNANCWGIQFHPEYIDKIKSPEEYQRQSRIFTAFNSACLAYHNKRSMNKELLHNFDSIKLRKVDTKVEYSPVVEDEPLKCIPSI
jgi:putative glutamine amidotransferase